MRRRRQTLIMCSLALILAGIGVMTAHEAIALLNAEQGSFGRAIALSQPNEADAETFAEPSAPTQAAPPVALWGSGMLRGFHRPSPIVAEQPPANQVASLDPAAMTLTTKPPALSMIAAPDIVAPVAPLPPSRPLSLRAPVSLSPIMVPPPVAPPAVTSVSPAPATTIVAPDASSLGPDRSGGGNFQMGSAAYVRIFKREAQLELWLKRNGRYALFRTYAICKWSGKLGPKLREGDYQSPEGFYAVSARQLNPHSHYHRAFDVGYPNAFDRRLGRTGRDLMVHGDCKSVGCFALTDKVIEEVYNYVEAALRGGQHEVPVHIFPFRLTETALNKETAGDWASLWQAPYREQASFWRNLKEGYDLFEQAGEPPSAYACGDRYAFGAAGKSCTRIAGW